MALLTLSNIHVRYGSVEVLHGIDLHVDEGEIVTILGANGAGKSTTLLSISGLVRPCEGEIIFDSKPLLKYPSHEVVNLGIAQSPEGRRVFGTMSVLENLRLGAFCIRDKERSERTLEWIFELFPRSWWSRTPVRLSSWPRAAMCWKWATWPWRTRPPICWPTPACAKPIWAANRLPDTCDKKEPLPDAGALLRYGLSSGGSRTAGAGKNMLLAVSACGRLGARMTAGRAAEGRPARCP